MHILWLIIVVSTVVAAVRYAMFPTLVFKVSIADGTIRVTKGRVERAFIQEIRTICRDRGVTRGWFGGTRRRRRVSLVFSRGMPPDFQQQIRNLWVNK